MDLDIIRHEIDQVDDQIVHLLEKRMHLVDKESSPWKVWTNRQPTRNQITSKSSKHGS